MISKSKFLENEIPYKMLEDLGISRKNVLDMPKDLIEPLVNGRITPLTDYSWHGIGLMVVFFLFRDKPVFNLLFGFPFLIEYGVIGTFLGILSCLCYNGNRGFIRGKWQKYCFYLYYPLHLMLICLFLD